MTSLLLFLILCAILLRWLTWLLARNPELLLRLLGRLQAAIAR